MVGRLPIYSALLTGALLAVAVLGSCSKHHEYEKGDILHSTLESSTGDDRITDKHPAFYDEFTISATISGRDMWINRSTSIIGLDMVGMIEEDEDLAGKLFSSFREAVRGNNLVSLDMVDAYTKDTDDKLYAAVELFVHDRDGVYPGGKQGFLADMLAELALQPQSTARDSAIAYIAAAYELGGGQAYLDAGLRKLTDDEIARFEATPRFSKPVGFYTKSEVLKRIFRRDRMLQQAFATMPPAPSPNLMPVRDIAVAIQLALALESRPEMVEAYGKYIALADRLTNPASNMHLLDLLEQKEQFANPQAVPNALFKSDACRRCVSRGNANPSSLGVAFWPFSTAKENKLFAQLYAGQYPEDDETMEQFIRAIEDGRVSLLPDPDSGWYDYQLFALETILLPRRGQEKDKFLLHEKYKDRLKKAFASLTTQRRETHIKQVQEVEAGFAVDMPYELQTFAPELSVEPALTHYLRTAQAYVKLEDLLAEVFGDELLLAIPLDGKERLVTGLSQAQSLHFGLFLLNCNEIGLRPQVDDDVLVRICGGMYMLNEEDLPERRNIYPVAWEPGLTTEQQLARCELTRRASQWLNGIHNDPAMQNNVCVIVPVLSSMDGSRHKYWAVLGVELQRIRSWYAEPPLTKYDHWNQQSDKENEQARADASAAFAKGYCPDPAPWEDKEYLLPVYHFVEIELGPEPPNREELQAICSQFNSEKEIVTALHKRFGP